MAVSSYQSVLHIGASLTMAGGAASLLKTIEKSWDFFWATFISKQDRQQGPGGQEGSNGMRGNIS